MKRAVALLAGLSLIAGCSMEPKYTRPSLPVPASWPQGDAYLRQSEATLARYDWRSVFPDPRLQSIIGQALANNQDIARAVANIEVARAQYRIQRAELLPQIDVSTNYRRADSGNSPIGTGNGAGVARGERDSFSVQGGGSSYELDLFGRLRSLADADRNRYLGSEAAARAARLTLVGDVVDAWLAYARDKSLLAIAQQTAAAARDSARLTERRLRGGIVPRSDLRQAQIVLTTAEADIAEQTTAVAQDLNALELLVGARVDPVNLPQAIEEAGARLAEVPAGLDSSILLRRPDVVEAEWQLRAANAEIGAARAALFPRISLTGLLGFASDALGALFTSGAFSWQAGGDATYAIFAGGAARAGVDLSKAQRDAALADYRKATQGAFADVANALARRGTIDAQLRASSTGRDAAADNLHLAELRYRGGIDSYLENLQARQSLYTAERSLVNTHFLRASNLVALYRSIGGDASITGVTKILR